MMNMKLTKAIIRNFKRYDEVEFNLPQEHVVIAGPNNTGKTTLLQAMLTWQLALQQWRELSDKNPRNSAYAKAPMARQALFSVPLSNAAMLWFGAKPNKKEKIEISLVWNGLACPVEIVYDTTEQFYVRPVYDLQPFTDDYIVASGGYPWFDLDFPEFVYIPAISGITMNEPLYQPAKISELLGQGRSGDILRNLLAEVHKNEARWDYLKRAIKDLFDYELLPPDTKRANISAEYKTPKGTVLEVASAGSGFLQILMLLAFLSARKKSLLLLDEPDAHLHILLQDRVFSALKRFADINNSTLIIATHSERIINTVEPHHLCVLLDKPKLVADTAERGAIITALTAIENVDIMLAQEKEGILYVEGHTDIAILREWARVLGHRLFDFLQMPFWKPINIEAGETIKNKYHYEALCQINENIKAIELSDSDGHNKDTQLKPYANSGLHHFHWARYEIESYLLHPQRLAAFAAEKTGQQEAGEAVLSYLTGELPPKIINEPLINDNEYLRSTKAKKIIIKALEAGGLQNFSDMSKIAAAMKPEEIHPEVIEKLNAIAEHFGIK